MSNIVGCPECGGLVRVGAKYCQHCGCCLGRGIKQPESRQNNQPIEDREKMAKEIGNSVGANILAILVLVFFGFQIIDSIHKSLALYHPPENRVERNRY
jgi:uncharacterized membrane protein YvbJ